MKTLSKPATLTFQKILQEMNGKEYLKLNRAPDAFMPLTIERLTDIPDFPAGPVVMYSLAHYYKQNGDLVPDPEMTFAATRHAIQDFAIRQKAEKQPPHPHTPSTQTLQVYPMTFQNAWYYNEGIFFAFTKWVYHHSRQSDMTRFANLWLKNIKWQQDL
jgi:hypothetical protein